MAGGLIPSFELIQALKQSEPENLKRSEPEKKSHWVACHKCKKLFDVANQPDSIFNGLCCFCDPPYKEEVGGEG